ncbi:MAG: right-handed parallel beta-helix repeat-containing protein [Planctomycetes bacterium]|nr:right-handed parallel beta-helix repeat-containing protein [Planctomycetota bacterium]
MAILGGFAGPEIVAGQRDPSANLTILSGDLNGDDQPGLLNRSDNAYHVIVGTGAGAGAVLDGFEIRGGQADAATGTNAIGGGLWLASGSPTLRSCTFTDNVATRGAGLYASTGAAPLLDACTFRANTALSDGGAIYNLTAAPILLNCVLEDNRATNTAGGIRNQDGSSPTLVNCLLAGNEKDAVYNRESSNPVMINCTVVNSGLFGVRNLASSVPLITNGIVWSNGSGAINGTATVSHSCIEGGATGDANVPGDPLFVAAASGNYRLSLGSPCVNAGDNAALSGTGVTLDLDGGARIVHDRVDAGVYENPAAGRGDGNGDNRIDMADYLLFSACLFGPDTLPSPLTSPPTASLCLNAFDANADNDVDASDFGSFQRRFGTGGP